MTTLKQYIVDAFTDRVFSGNPAAVCIMNGWIDDRAMQNIAVENRFSETAFAVKENGRYHLRWFTPGGEVELCGHATLATASVILNFTEPGLDKVEFDTLSGRLTVTKKGDLLSMDFPSFELKPLPLAEPVEDAAAVRAFLDGIRSRYSNARIDSYVRDCFGGRDTYSTEEVPVDTAEDFVLFLMSTIRGQERSAFFTAEFLVGDLQKNGSSLPRVLFRKKRRRDAER